MVWRLKRNMNPKYVEGSVMSQEDYEGYKARGLNLNIFVYEDSVGSRDKDIEEEDLSSKTTNKVGDLDGDGDVDSRDEDIKGRLDDLKSDLSDDGKRNYSHDKSRSSPGRPKSKKKSKKIKSKKRGSKKR